LFGRIRNWDDSGHTDSMVSTTALDPELTLMDGSEEVASRPCAEGECASSASDLGLSSLPIGRSPERITQAVGEGAQFGGRPPAIWMATMRRRDFARQNHLVRTDQRPRRLKVCACGIKCRLGGLAIPMCCSKLRLELRPQNRLLSSPTSFHGSKDSRKCAGSTDTIRPDGLRCRPAYRPSCCLTL
jgi:hypothetical protein